MDGVGRTVTIKIRARLELTTEYFIFHFAQILVSLNSIHAISCADFDDQFCYERFHSQILHYSGDGPSEKLGWKWGKPGVLC